MYTDCMSPKYFMRCGVWPSLRMGIRIDWLRTDQHLQDSCYPYDKLPKKLCLLIAAQLVLWMVTEMSLTNCF